jgi:hypothetical protein
MVNDKEIKNLYIEKTKRMLAFLGFQSIGDLNIDVYLLRFNSAKITVDKKNRVRVLAIEVFCYPDQETQWYIDIPVMLLDNKHTINTCGHIENSLLHTYIEKQTKYLRLFDRLHKNALYLHEKVEVNMNIIDTHDEKIPENEFEVKSFTFTARVSHPKIKIQGVGTLIENLVIKRFRDYDMSIPTIDSDISEQTLQDTLLLCDMMTI